MIKNKRGQFFLIFAVIIGIAILVAATQLNRTSKDSANKDMFEIRCQNYKNEIFKISEYAISNGKKEQEFQLIEQFSDPFYEYMNKNYDSFNMSIAYGNETVQKTKVYSGESKAYTFNSDDSFYVYMKAKKGGEIYVCE